MSLDEVFNEDPHVSKATALRCIREHGVEDELDNFFIELGDHDEYSSKAVLMWLGY